MNVGIWSFAKRIRPVVHILEDIHPAAVNPAFNWFLMLSIRALSLVLAMFLLVS